jgi:hypothetical protein
MSNLQTTIAVICLIITLVLLIGLAIRHRYAVAYTFTIYLIVVFVTELLGLVWPDRFYRRAFYLQKENLINALRFGVALELMYRTFRAFPAAHRTARAVFLVFVSVTLAVVMAATTSDQPDVYTLVNKVQPQVISASVWLFTALAALILWYRLPVESFHKAILLGWVPYLLIFSAALNYVGSNGSPLSEATTKRLVELTNYVHTVPYLVLLAFWARAAWAPVGVRVSAAAKPSVALQSSAG